jgi:hypothetical protein
MFFSRLAFTIVQSGNNVINSNNIIVDLVRLALYYIREKGKLIKYSMHRFYYFELADFCCHRSPAPYIGLRKSTVTVSVLLTIFKGLSQTSVRMKGP